jgi:hypothetical protein
MRSSASKRPVPGHYDQLNGQTEGNGKMAIYLVTHRKGGNSADVIAAASRLKALATKHGAEDLQLHTEVAGPAAGQWVLVIRFSDWASYGRAMESAQADPTTQAVLADLEKIAEMTSRRLGAGVDI